MRYICLILYALMAGVMICAAQNTMRGRKLTTPPRHTTVGDAVSTDTIAVDSNTIIFSGYDKTLRSRKESVFVSNRSGHHACAITFSIEYQDMNGRQLHRVRHTLECDLPADQTRLITFPAWDTQQVWYYYLSQPARTSAQATPYRVAITPEKIYVRRDHE